MSNSINTNIAAYYAQQNITTASNQASENVARLSSGNAIVEASDNVAALAVGTSLGSQVNVLTAAQTNAAQGTSLLQVADGALAQIQQILQQMQSLANQAESGSLTNTDRGFLNQQFAQLTNEIDSLSQGTTFNGVSLINGSIAGGSALSTNVTTGSATTPPQAVIGKIITNSGLSAGTFTLAIDGQPSVTLTFGNATGDVGVGATAADSASNLASALNNSGLSQLSNFRFSADTSGNVYAYYTGSASSLTNIPTVTASSNVADTIISGAAGSGNALGAASFSAATTIGTIADGDVLNVNDTITVGTHTVTFDANGTNGLGYNAGTGAIDLGTGTNTEITSGALANVAAYLNSKVGSGGSWADLTGITFSTAGTDGNLLVATYTGSSATPPTISTSYHSATPDILTTSGTAQNTNGATSILTVGSSGLTTGGADIDADSTLSIGGISVTFGTGNDVTLSNTLSTTLSNLAAYLNTTAVQTTLNGAYKGMTFTSDGTHLYANNTIAGNAAITGSSPTVAVTLTNSLAGGAVGTASGSVASSSTETAITLGGTTFGFNLNAGNTLTVGTQVLTFVAYGQTPTGTTQIELGTTVQGTLDNIVSYINANKADLGVDTNFTASDTPSTPSSTSIILTNGSTGPITAPIFTFGAGSQPSNAISATTSTVIAPSAVVGIFDGNFNVGDTIQVGTNYFIIAANGTAAGGSGSSPSPYKLVLGSSPTTATTLAALATFLNTGAQTGVTATDGTPLVTNTIFAANGSQLVAQNDQGLNSGTVTITYTSVANPSFTGVIGANLASISSVGLGAGTTSAVGTPSGSLFVTSAGTAVTDYGNGVDLSLVANNSKFVGSFGGTGNIGAITGTYVNTGSNGSSGVQFSVVVGNDTYTTGTITNDKLTSTTAPVTVTFTGNNTTSSAPEGGSFTLNLKPQASDVLSQNQAYNLANGINTALSSVAAYQNRTVLSFNNNYSASVGGVQKATLAGSSLTFNSNDFTSPLISSVTVAAPSTGSTDAKISAVINGDTFSSIAGIGDTFSKNNEITLVNQSNPDQTLTLTLGSADADTVDLSSSSNASAFQTALSNSLGIGTGTSGGLTFQLGATASANVTVKLSSATSSSLFGGVAQDISTSDGAATAAAAVTNALNTVTAQRATTGAFESQFNFAAAALQSSVQNETAAQSQLLDTNIATESTAYATNQVKLQAGISVLAQANQQAQALLKLIG